MKNIAHVYKNKKNEYITHDLFEHLNSVANIAKLFAAKFGGEELAYLAGLQHDFGKYSKEFQIYIRQETGFESDIASQYKKPTPQEKQHAVTGALNICKNLNNNPIAHILSYIVSGHHTGLSNFSDISNKLKNNWILDKAISNNPPQLYNFNENILSEYIHKSLSDNNGSGIHLWIRMLFSCLVDADYLDTEKFMQPTKSRIRKSNKIKYLLPKFNKYIKAKQAQSAASNLNKIRNNILQYCIDAGKSDPGIFSLTVPTGGGKTLSSVAFALEHCKKYNKDRIIIALPYTSIIEQTAKELKLIFGENNVLEHHSNLDPENQTSKRSKLACENWDYPIIVTTNVQLFESLFSNKTSKCRKLHNICNSVIILDEAQMLPTEYLKPILDSLRTLVNIFGCTLLLCTATQPTLAGEVGTGQSRFAGLQNVKEIIPTTIDLFSELKRTNINIVNEIWSWDHIKEKLLHYKQVLCIVNTKKDCADLCDKLPEDTFYLSTRLCAEHRSDIISEIKTRLKKGLDIRVVSTQLIEAGVDIDFPVVFRAMAGLDSVIQSAGRCNREGKLEKGDVFVFSPDKSNPPISVKLGAQCTNEIATVSPQLIQTICSQTFKTYFTYLYNKIRSFDSKNICELLKPTQFEFETASKEFSIINNNDKPVVVKYKNSQHYIDQINENISKDLVRKLQRYSVNIKSQDIDKLLENKLITQINGIYVQIDNDLYDQKYGLIF